MISKILGGFAGKVSGSGITTSAAKKIGVGALAMDAINVAGGVSDYNNARKEGDSQAVSVAKAVGSFIFYEATGVFGVGLTAIQVGATLANTAAEHTTKQMAGAYESAGKFGSGYFEMSKPAYTMRQRSLNAIRNNGLNTQSALGNEARTYYRTSI